MSKLSAAQIAEAAHNAGFYPASVLSVAVAIALAESGGETTATNKNTNGSTDFGLWQINSVHADILRGGSWSNPQDNAIMAHRVYADAGNRFTPWTTYTSGRYLAFMSVARAAVLGGGMGGAVLPPSSSVQGSAKTNAVPSGLPIPSPVAPLAGLVGLAELLTSPAMWLRAAMLLGGGLCVWWGLRAMSELDNQAAAAIGKGALAVATDGASLAASGATKTAKAVAK